MESNFNVHHLASWYFGNFCAMKYSHGRECDYKLHKIASELEKRGIKEMTHKEFCIIARENLTCKPITVKHNECPICNAIKIKHKH